MGLPVNLLAFCTAVARSFAYAAHFQFSAFFRADETTPLFDRKSFKKDGKNFALQVTQK